MQLLTFTYAECEESQHVVITSDVIRNLAVFDSVLSGYDTGYDAAK